MFSKSRERKPVRDLNWPRRFWSRKLSTDFRTKIGNVSLPIATWNWPEFLGIFTEVISRLPLGDASNISPNQFGEKVTDCGPLEKVVPKAGGIQNGRAEGCQHPRGHNIHRVYEAGQLRWHDSQRLQHKGVVSRGYKMQPVRALTPDPSSRMIQSTFFPAFNRRKTVSYADLAAPSTVARSIFGPVRFAISGPICDEWMMGLLKPSLWK